MQQLRLRQHRHEGHQEALQGGPRDRVRGKGQPVFVVDFYNSFSVIVDRGNDRNQSFSLLIYRANIKQQTLL